MTRDLSALKPAGLQLLFAGLFVGGLLLLGSTGAVKLIVPSPDNTAGELLRGLSAHREPAAHRTLTRELREQEPPERLEQLAERLGRVSQVSTETVDEQPDRATVRATLRMGAGEERELELPLVKEGVFWRVASLEPLRALASPS